jgi:hypothetical protein
MGDQAIGVDGDASFGETFRQGDDGCFVGALPPLSLKSRKP